MKPHPCWCFHCLTDRWEQRLERAFGFFLLWVFSKTAEPHREGPDCPCVTCHEAKR